MASSSVAYAKARQLIDDIHRQDPRFERRKEQQAAQGAAAAAGIPGEGLEVTQEAGPAPADEDGQDELSYADAMEQWVDTLLQRAGEGAESRLAALPGGRDLIRLAARCQHLQRFATPRSTFPEGKAGYLQWRRSLYTKQADKAVELMTQAGMSPEESQHVYKWVSKTDLKPGRLGGEWGTQVSAYAHKLSG